MAPASDAVGPPVLCLAGPTAAGKTAAAVALAERYPLDLISVDSAMVYRQLDIGTAKPDAATLARAPHALIDIRDPWQKYSAGEFRTDVLGLIAQSHARGRWPLLVGGTMLYFRALREGLASLPPADPVLRAELDARAARFGWPALHAELAGVDPAAAARIDPHDGQRIQRALEVFQITAEPLSSLQAQSTRPPAFEFRCVAMLPVDRALLYQRIETRLDTMLEAGFLTEVQRLFELPAMHADLPAMRAVGYRQLWAHLQGQLSLADACQQARAATRRYAKRQLTWLRSEPAFQPVDCQAGDLLEELARRMGTASLAGAN